MTDAYKFRAVMGRLIVDAWASEELMRVLQMNPKRVLSDRGLHPPSYVNISVHRDTDRIEYVIAQPGWAGKYGPGIMQKLIDSPRSALESVGLRVRDGVEYKVLFNSNEHVNIIIPRKPLYYECSIEKIR